jgi:aspartyl-tRNA(Asn)/glutamyl-tRNA(Gln) amidotransferase subunit C
MKNNGLPGYFTLNCRDEMGSVSVTLSDSDIRSLARLARLRVEEGELKHLREKLNAVVELIAKLQAVDTNGVEPMAHPHDPVLRLRDDVVSEGDARDDLQAPAPLLRDGLYLVPRVLD